MKLLRTWIVSALFVSLAAAQPQPYPFPPVLVPPILPGHGIVGGSASGNYQLYLVPGLGTAVPGTPSLLPISAAMALRTQRFVIDQARADIIAATSPSVSGGPVEIWRIRVLGTAVISETLLTTLSGTNGLLSRAMHRDNSGCIFVLCGPGVYGPTFTVHRVAVASNGALATPIAISNPQNDMILALATIPGGQILLGGRRAPYSAASPGVTLTVSQLGGTPAVATVIPGFHVNAAETTATGIAVLGLWPQTSPPPANYSCGGTQLNRQFSTPTLTTLFNDIERTQAGEIVLAGVGFFALGQPGGVVKYAVTGGCQLAATPNAQFLFPHGINCVAVAFASNNYGCALPPFATAVPSIVQLGQPTIGQPWVVTLTGGAPSATAVLVSGRSDRLHQGIPLPRQLSVIGGQANGFLLTSAEVVNGAVPTDAAGNATNSVTVPNNPALIGTKQFSEWLVYTGTPGVPPYNSAGLVSTIQ